MKKTINIVKFKNNNSINRILIPKTTTAITTKLNSLSLLVHCLFQQQHQQTIQKQQHFHASLFCSNIFNNYNNNELPKQKQEINVKQQLNQLNDFYNQINRNDTNQMTRFYQTLLSNNQYIIAIIYEKTTNLNQQQNTSANFIEIKIPKINVHYVPIFTSIDNANQFLKRFNGLKDKVNVVALPLVPVFDFIVNLDKYSNNNTIDIPDLMLNPHCASVDGLQFTKSKIKKLLAGKFETIERDLLKEDEFPEKLLERLNKEFIEKNKTVVKEVNCKVLDGPDMYFLMEIGLNKESIIGNEEKPVLTNELVQFINETEGIPSLKYPYFVTFKF